MSMVEKRKTIDYEQLMQIAQKILCDETIHVTEWNTTELQGGTAGQVYAVNESCT